MQEIHFNLKKSFSWYDRWHNHPRHQHAHWFGLFVFLLLITSFISAQVVFFYAEKLEAQAQTTLPAPNHQMMLGYYHVVAQYGDYLDDVSGYTNTQIILENSFLRTGLDDITGFNNAFNRSIAAGDSIIFAPDFGDPSLLDRGLEAARPFWNNINYIYLADEPDWDRATTEANITSFENTLSQKGLAQKEIIINFDYDDIMIRDGFTASNLDIVSFEAYADASTQNDTNLINILNTRISNQMSRIGNRRMIIVGQSYNRNGTWTNLTSLQSIQNLPYLASYNNTNVVGLLLFSYARPGGARDLGDCVKNEHRKMWGAISGTAQPASASCGGTTVTPTPSISTSPIPDAADATPGWRGSLAYNPDANNWLVVSAMGGATQPVNWIYGRIMSDDAVQVTNYFQINTSVLEGSQTMAPKVAYDTDMDRYLVIWVDFGTGGIIHGQFVAQDGSLIGNNFAIPNDLTGAVYLESNSPMLYDSVNGRYVFAWETRDDTIDTNIRTINGDGTINPSIRVTDGPWGTWHTAPMVEINPSDNEYCVAFSYCGPDSNPPCDAHGNIGIRRVDAITGQLGPITYGNNDTYGAPLLSYNSTDDNYLLSFANNADAGGSIMSSCDTSTMGPVFTVGNRFSPSGSAYNPSSNTFAVIGQNWDNHLNGFAILDNTGASLQSLNLFDYPDLDPRCTSSDPAIRSRCFDGNFAPSVAANSSQGTYAAISSKRYAITRFISPLGFIGGPGPTPTPVPTPAPCAPGVVQSGIPVICDFTPSIARPGDPVNITGGNLSATVQLFDASGGRYTMVGTADSTGSNVSFNILVDIPEGDYTVSVLGSDGTTRATSSKILNVTYAVPSGLGATGAGSPFGEVGALQIPGSTMTFSELISSSLDYAVYALGLAVFVVMLYAGFLWITSAANPGNIALAKRYMTNAIIGAVLLLSSYIILYTINPDLVGGRLELPGILRTSQPLSTIVQPTCDGGVCSNNSGNACTIDTDCNTICINNICNNGALGTCTLDTDCAVNPQFIVTNEVQSATAFSSGCSRVINTGFQDLAAVECPSSSMALAQDTIMQLQDSGANQQISATTVHNNGNIGAGRRIVVLDTGYNYNHPELSSSYGGGKDFVNNDDDPMDDHGSGTGSPGHGSHVAGIITADGINAQARGVAPGTEIIAGKVLDGAGRGYFSTVATAIYWAVNGPDNVYGTVDDFQADAINLSVGGGNYTALCDNADATSREMLRAIEYAKDHGVAIVIAAGNSGSSGVAMPGCISKAFTVGAVDSTNAVTNFSGRGTGVDIVAPGASIFSSLLGGNYGNKSGTSMASPIVAGVIALIKSAFPNYTVDQVEQAIINTATDLGTAGKDTSYGWGLINANTAVGGSTACTGACGNITASPASCTIGTASPCNITLGYTTSGTTPASLVILKNGASFGSLAAGSGTLTDSNMSPGIYTYTISERSSGNIIARTNVSIYNQGSLNTDRLSCKKNEDPSNPNCNIVLNYSVLGGLTSYIYKNGLSWRAVNSASGTITDTNPATGTHTYTLRDSSGTTQLGRVVSRVESATPRSRVISSISPTTVRGGQQITINGINLGNELEVSNYYCTVQFHNKDRVRSTTVGTLNAANTQCIVTVPPGWLTFDWFATGNFTLRVGPDLILSNVSNEVSLTILP